MRYTFDQPLREGVVIARPNRFIMDVTLPEGQIRCHCPVVSRIGDIDTAGLPCLVSKSDNPKRKFAHTVEAISLNRPEDPHREWIGINQTASNRYVEWFLARGLMEPLTGADPTVRREVRHGDSRLDFLVNDDLFLEVKTPLVQIQADIPGYVGRLPAKPFSSTERSLKHMENLAESLEDHERAAVLYCFYYDNPGFRFYHGTTFDEVRATVERCRDRGVELWQANFRQDETGIGLGSLRPLELDWREP